MPKLPIFVLNDVALRADLKTEAAHGYSRGWESNQIMAIFKGRGEIKRTGSQMMVIQEREKSKGNCEEGGWSRAERGLDCR